MQNAQSNALVAGLIILAFVELERASAWRAAAAVVLGACVKIFPLAALTFALPRRLVVRTGVWAAAIGATLVALPLLVTSPSVLRAQYGWWRGVESIDAQQRWFSVMELVHRWTGSALPNWPIQLAGTLLLVAPLALRRDRWDEARFRFSLSLLAAAIRGAVQPSGGARELPHRVHRCDAVARRLAARTLARGLYGIAFVTIPLMSTLIPGPIIRTQTVVLYRLAVPCLAIWVAIQWEFWRALPRVER